MREIMFRVWDSVNEKMYEVGEIKFTGRTSDPYIVFTEYGEIVENPIVMQYTGLDDGKGNRIYEGDILKPLNPPSSKKHNRVVNFADGSFCYDHGAAKGKYGYWALTQDKANLFKIIGNIYENPELLKSNNNESL